MDYDGDDNLLEQPVVPGSATRIGDLVTERELVHTLGRAAPQTDPCLRAALAHDWLCNPVRRRRGRRSAALAATNEAEAGARRSIRLLAHVTALHRVIRNVDKTGNPAAFTADEQIAASVHVITLQRMTEAGGSFDATDAPQC